MLKNFQGTSRAFLETWPIACFKLGDPSVKYIPSVLLLKFWPLALNCTCALLLGLH